MYSVEQYATGEIAVIIRDSDDEDIFRDICNEFGTEVVPVRYSDHCCSYKYRDGICYHRDYHGKTSNYCSIGFYESSENHNYHAVEVELNMLMEYVDRHTEHTFDEAGFLGMIGR